MRPLMRRETRYDTQAQRPIYIIGKAHHAHFPLLVLVLVRLKMCRLLFFSAVAVVAGLKSSQAGKRISESGEA